MVKRKFLCKLIGSDIRRLGLQEDLNTERSYEGGQPEDDTRIPEEVWQSVGNDGGKSGWYYGRNVDDSNKYRIYLYKFQQCSSITTSSPSRSSPEGGEY